MKRKRLTFYYIILMLICLAPMPVLAVSEGQKMAIVDHCESIKDSLKNVQKQDARTRVYLGGRYETILSGLIMPLNVRLIENSLSSAELVENQSDFAERKVRFSDNYISYQQGLEELVSMNCREEPERFYEKLTEVRAKRNAVNKDVAEMRKLITKNIELVRGLMKEL